MNRISSRLPLCAVLTAFLPAVVQAAVSSISVTGWTQDIVINGAGPYNTSVTSTMDGGIGSIENNTWVEAGNYLDENGAPASFLGLTAGTKTSLTGNGTFTFQDFTGNNALLLTSGLSSTLVLDSPNSFATLALYGCTGSGPTTATITLTFSDSSTSNYLVASGTGIGTDWFNESADKALEVGARASNKSEEGYTRLFYQENAVIGINETFLTLTPADQAKTLTSVQITNTLQGTMAVFAISGELIPEVSTSTLIAAFGVLGLVRRKRV